MGVPQARAAFDFHPFAETEVTQSWRRIQPAPLACTRSPRSARTYVVNDWGNVLPTQSICLIAPVAMPDQSEGDHAQDQRARAREMNNSLSNDGSSAETEACE